MNKLEKQTAAVAAAMSALGWERDRFGHFKSPSGELRLKVQKTSVRLERRVKTPTGTWSGSGGEGFKSDWFKITGSFIRDVKVLADGRVAVGSKVLKKPEVKA